MRLGESQGELVQRGDAQLCGSEWGIVKEMSKSLACA